MTGIDPYLLGAMVGRQLPFFSLIVPFWLIWAFAGWRGMLEVWPAVLVIGVSFAVPQFLISNFINPWIVDIGASLISMACLIGFLKVWQPKELWTSPALRTPRRLRSETMPPPAAPKSPADHAPKCGAACCRGSSSASILLVWGTDWFKVPVNPIFTWNYPVEGLHNLINKVPPVVAKPTPGGRGVLLHLAVLHRHGHADRGDHLRLPDGLLAGAAGHRLRRGRSGWCAIR